MRKILSLLVACVLVASVSGISFAADAPKAAEPAKAAAAVAATTVKMGKGEVTAVDAAAKTITVKSKKGNAVISIGDDSVINVGKETKALADVKVGDKVKVTVAKPSKKK